MTIGKKFQWIKTENAGKEVIVTGEEDGFIIFNDKSRCNKKLMNQYLLEVDSSGESLPLANDISGKKEILKKKPLAEKLKPKSSEREIGDNMYSGAPDNPVRELLKRQSSNNRMRSELVIDVNIPKPSVYAILKESFGDDVDSEITQMAIESININELKDKLDELLKKKVKSYYSKSKK